VRDRPLSGCLTGLPNSAYETCGMVLDRDAHRLVCTRRFGMAQTGLQYANSQWTVSVPRHGSVAEFEASPQQQAQRRLHCRGPDPGRNIRSTTAALRRADRRGIVSHASERRTYV